jgi:hypothetical protein
MMRLRFPIILMSVFVASALCGQEKPAMDPEACAKHCKEMAAAQQKVAEQRQAAWEEIEAQLEVAKNARGDKKVAALESVVERLVAYHASLQAGAAGCTEMAGHGHGAMTGHAAGCCGGEVKSCCGSAGAMGHAGHEAHCPMMKGSTADAEPPKPAK